MNFDNFKTDENSDVNILNTDLPVESRPHLDEISRRESEFITVATRDDLDKTVIIRIIGSRRDGNDVLRYIKNYNDIWYNAFRTNPDLFNGKYRDTLDITISGVILMG